MLGQGTDSQQAMDEIGQVVEGFYNTKETYLLAQRQDVEMPITEQIYQMLFCGKSAQEVALSLLGRERKRRIRRKNDVRSMATHSPRGKRISRMRTNARKLFPFHHFKTSKSWQCLSYLLANKLANPIMPAISLREIIEEAYQAEPNIIDCAACDIKAVRHRDPAVELWSTPLLYLKGFHAIQSYRITHYLWNQNRKHSHFIYKIRFPWLSMWIFTLLPKLGTALCLTTLPVLSWAKLR